ncbi:MAG TPA: ComF family protein, partial [Accumulibacter sp.]|uniref:ComF family protein n=1 Tax=Accumulibacter sp. TaxID=2053492 RepID=UPI002C15054E
DCLLCAADSRSSLLCTACADDLPRLPAESCPRCALPTPAGEVCGRCLRQAPHYDAALAAFRYAFPVDRLIQTFKYDQRLALADYFGRRLAVLAAACTADVIVPLPLHPLRLRERGFNQALELARPVSRSRAIALDAHSCQRIRHTPAQAALPWRERTRNVRGAFHCTTDFTHRRILLIDDVMTTGASLDEMARTLKLHGASQVTVLVVARALPP